MTEQDLYYMKEALLEGEKPWQKGKCPLVLLWCGMGKSSPVAIICAIRQKILCAMRKLM